MTPFWDEIARHFEEDPETLRDIYVLETTHDDWYNFLIFVRDEYPCRFSLDGGEVPLPMNIMEIVKLRDSHATSLRIDVGSGITAYCHFFIGKEDASLLELDIDARNIKDEGHFKLLWKFITGVGKLLNRKVILTYENSMKEVIASYEPSH